jgi:imidazolonepropionase-like amidohydrolase
MIRKILIINFLFILFGSNQVPGPKQTKPILLRGGTLHTISNGVLNETDLLFEDGKIIKIGKNLLIPNSVDIIELEGRHVYPSLISSGSTIGLQEVGAVRATRDYAETGKVNPNVRANVSYNPDSELIPITRSNGVLLGLSVPRSGIISGVSSLMMLDGWTWEDATLKHPVGLHIFWPSMNLLKNHDDVSKSKDKSEKILKSIQVIEDLIIKSKAYKKLKDSNSKSFEHDLRLEGMLPVINKQIPIFIHANEIKQIESAIYWSDRHGLDMILVGGKDSWRATELLKDRKIAVIYTQTHSVPMRRFEKYEQSFLTPFQLYQAGVKFCISNSESPFQTPHIRNLPYYASKAAAYGLPWEEALRSITLSPAEILGVQSSVGSLEEGKDATLFIASGDILEIPTQVDIAFIQGKLVELDDKHKTLNKKYRKKYQQKKMESLYK